MKEKNPLNYAYLKENKARGLTEAIEAQLHGVEEPLPPPP